MKSVLITLCIVLSGGCSITLPLRWETPQTAFPAGVVNENSSPGAMASRQSVFDFPFEEVFTSAEKALSFAQVNITESEKPSGKIYGTRSSLVNGQTLKRYYLVNIREDGPEKCTVSIHSKEQQSAVFWKWGTSVVLPSVAMAAFAFLTLDPSDAIAPSLVLPVLISPVVYFLNEDSKKNAMLKWSKNDDEYLDRVMSFIRTDLLQQ